MSVPVLLPPTPPGMTDAEGLGEELATEEGDGDGLGLGEGDGDGDGDGEGDVLGLGLGLDDAARLDEAAAGLDDAAGLDEAVFTECQQTARGSWLDAYAVCSSSVFR
jgi:hypothetical protein